MLSKTYTHIYELAESLPVISSHEHLLSDPIQDSLDLDKLIANSYLAMLKIPAGRNAEEHAKFLEQCRHNNLFVWIEKSVQRIYGFTEKITARNWENISAMIRQKHQKPDALVSILKENAGYQRAIQDAYWDYFSDNGHSEILTPNMRTDMFVSAFHPDCTDHDGNSPFTSFPDLPSGNFRDYLDGIESLFTRVRANGAVALKSVMAYERPIQFDAVEFDSAAKIFRRHPSEVSLLDRKAYGDFMFAWFCGLSERLAVPFQIHTGMAKLTCSDPMLLAPVIERFPGIKFVLFHAGYPWYDSMVGLVCRYPNVFVDMVWVPHISITGAVLALHEIIEGIPSNTRIGWGGDARTAEEAYGALLAWRHVISRVLSEKVEDGYFDLKEAEALVHKLMYQNVGELYGMKMIQ